jgi:membrane associated rhomboid family serine protease
MLALWGFGRTIILWFGFPHFAVIWAGSALAGSILQLGYWEKLEDPGRIHQAVGASGALFGLMSALAVVAPKMPMLLFFVPMTMRTAMIVSAALSLGAINQGWLPWLGHVDRRCWGISPFLSCPVSQRETSSLIFSFNVLRQATANLSQLDLGGMAFGFVYGLVALRRGRLSRISKYASRR